MKVVVAGGGFAGCAAAMQAARMGADVILIERTDMLGGTGAVGGIIRNNGRFTAAEEMIAMGGGQMLDLLDRNCRHKNIQFPGHAHASLFDVASVPAKIERELLGLGVKIYFMSRINSVLYLWKEKQTGNYQLFCVKDSNGQEIQGDVFIDATGTAGPAGMCNKYGNGCMSCILRCSAFGGRMSLCALCGIREYGATKIADICKDDKLNEDTQKNKLSFVVGGAMSGSCKLMKESLSKDLIDKLNSEGVAVIPIPKVLREEHLDIKACQQYALPEFGENIILLDTGHAKLMAPYYPLRKLRMIQGLENARFEDPYAGGIGNSIRFTSCVLREDTMRVCGMENVFCAGEKSGIFVGHTEAIVTGVLAGYNAVRWSQKKTLLTLPGSTACGDAIHWVGEQMKSDKGRSYKYTFSGSVLFERMKARNLYTTQKEQIKERVRKAGMENIFTQDL